MVISRKFRNFSKTMNFKMKFMSVICISSAKICPKKSVQVSEMVVPKFITSFQKLREKSVERYLYPPPPPKGSFWGEADDMFIFHNVSWVDCKYLFIFWEFSTISQYNYLNLQSNISSFILFFLPENIFLKSKRSLWVYSKQIQKFLFLRWF